MRVVTNDYKVLILRDWISIVAIEILHLSDQGTFTPGGAQGGSMDPLRKPLSHSTGILQWNLHHTACVNKSASI